MAPNSPLLPLSGLVLLSAPPKTGASAWAFNFAHAIATGRAVLGRPAAPPAPVLFVTFTRLPLVDLPAAENLYIADDLPTLDVDHCPVEMHLFAHRFCPALIVIDDLYGAAGKIRLDRRRSARKLMEILARLVPAGAGCVLLLHQTGVSGLSPSGSIELPLAADRTILLRRDAAGRCLLLHLEESATGRRSELVIPNSPEGCGEYLRQNETRART